MDELRLGRLFRSLVNTSLLSALAAPGCSSGDDGIVAEPLWPDLVGQLNLPACSDDGERTTPLAVNPASRVDYVGLYEVTSLEQLEAGTPLIGRMLEEAGTPCSGATDQAPCLAAFAAQPTDLEMDQSCGAPITCQQYYVLTTAGDTVRLWLPGEYTTLLGTIDTADEARLLTMGEHGVPACGSIRATANGFDVVGFRMTQDCAPIVTMRDHMHVAADGTVTLVRTNVASVSSACVGRRNEGLASAPEPCARPLADFFTTVAHLEAASVDAFRHLAAELDALGAPSELRSLALTAAKDEVRHADVMGRIARRFGGRPTPPEVKPLPLRDVETLALENMIEGCVRETFGALFATYQARAASDGEIARELAVVAGDETRHAALAWRIADWAGALMDDAARDRVRSAQRRAVSELRSELQAPIAGELREVAGVPDAAVAVGLLNALEHTLWS